jgi:hypothetical protein
VPTLDHVQTGARLSFQPPTGLKSP